MAERRIESLQDDLARKEKKISDLSKKLYLAAEEIKRKDKLLRATNEVFILKNRDTLPF